MISSERRQYWRYNMTENTKFEKLSRDDPDKTVIMAGYATFTIKQAEDEIDANSEIGRKLKSVEDRLKDY